MPKARLAALGFAIVSSISGWAALARADDNGDFIHCITLWGRETDNRDAVTNTSTTLRSIGAYSGTADQDRCSRLLPRMAAAIPSATDLVTATIGSLTCDRLQRAFGTGDVMLSSDFEPTATGSNYFESALDSARDLFGPSGESNSTRDNPQILELNRTLQAGLRYRYGGGGPCLEPAEAARIHAEDQARAAGSQAGSPARPSPSSQPTCSSRRWDEVVDSFSSGDTAADSRRRDQACDEVGRWRRQCAGLAQGGTPPIVHNARAVACLCQRRDRQHHGQSTSFADLHATPYGGALPGGESCSRYQSSISQAGSGSDSGSGSAPSPAPAIQFQGAGEGHSVRALH